MHHAPCPSLSLSFEIIFRILRRKSLDPRTLVSKLCSKKRIRGCSIFETREFHMGRSRENSVHGERIGKNPPSFGRKVSILVSNFCEGKGKEIIPLVYSAMLFFFPREEKLPFFYFSQRCFSTAKERKREREGKGRERIGAKLSKWSGRGRPSVARRQGGRKTSGGRGPLLERRKKAALFPSSGAATL